MFEVIWGRSRRRQRSRGRHSTRGSSRRWRSRIGASVTSPVAGRYRGGGRRSTARRTTPVARGCRDEAKGVVILCLAARCVRVLDAASVRGVVVVAVGVDHFLLHRSPEGIVMRQNIDTLRSYQYNSIIHCVEMG